MWGRVIYRKNRKKTNGCFIRDEANELNLNEEEYNRRIKGLCKRIDYYLTNLPVREVSITKLYY